jgi:hypothetical protein
MGKLCLVCGWLALAVSARANLSSYMYTGDPFDNSSGDFAAGCSGSYDIGTNCSGFITISFTVSAPLVGVSDDPIAPLSFSLSDQDGLTITQANATASTFTVSTDGSGNITKWYVSACISSTTCTDDTNPNPIQQITTASANLSPASGRPADLSFNDVYPTDPLGEQCLAVDGPGGSCPAFVSDVPTVNLGYFVYADLGIGGTWSLESSESPEPSTVLLLGTGLLAFAGWRRMHRHELDSPKV